MTAIDLWPFVLAIFVLGLTPGPVVVTTVATASVRGVSACWGLILGVAVADTILVGIVLVGLTAVISVIGPWFVVLKLAAGAYLVWLGIGLWRRPTGLPADGTERRGGNPSILAGTLLNLSNPKAIAFYAAFLPTFVDLRTIGLGEGLLVIGLSAAIPVMTNLFYAGLAARAARLLRSGRVGGLMQRVSGAVLVGAGIVVATR